LYSVEDRFDPLSSSRLLLLLLLALMIAMIMMKPLAAST